MNLMDLKNRQMVILELIWEISSKFRKSPKVFVGREGLQRPLKPPAHKGAKGFPGPKENQSLSPFRGNADVNDRDGVSSNMGEKHEPWRTPRRQR